MTTVMEILQEQETAVLVERHGPYFMGPLVARLLAEGVPDDQVEMIAYARNLAREEPDCMFALNSEGIRISREQGRMLAEAGIEITEVIGSHQARGPDTGLFICEGYHDQSDNWPPLRCHPAIDYPVYEYEVVLQALREEGEKFVGQWLNGDSRWQRLITSDTPRSFNGRVTGFIEDLLERGGRFVLASHYEITVLVHATYVNGTDLGQIDEGWAPEKSGGIIIWLEDGKIQARDYTPEFEIIE